MRKKVTGTVRAAARTFTLGRKRFAKISAVEGIRLSDEASTDFEEFDRTELSASERRDRIRRKYGKNRV